MIMTVCFGLICENRKSVIVVADRMLTHEGLSVEFEHTEPKIKQLTPNCLVATSGSATISDEVFEPVITKFKDISSAKIRDIAQEVAKSYSFVRLKKIEEQFFRPRGLSAAEFYANQTGLHEGLVARLDRVVDEFEFSGDFDVLIAGVDDSGAHIFYVTNPGTCNPLDAIGWGCIGSGMPHAENAIIASKYSPHTPFRKALYLAYSAKKHAEVAPGVGKKFTDMAFVDAKGKNTFITEKTKEDLKKIFEETEAPRIEKESALTKKLNELIIE